MYNIAKEKIETKCKDWIIKKIKKLSIRPCTMRKKNYAWKYVEKIMGVIYLKWILLKLMHSPPYKLCKMIWIVMFVI